MSADGKKGFVENRAENRGLVNWRKPVDINTLITIVAFVVGGLYFVSDTRAQLTSFASKFEDFEHRTDQAIDHITSRIDHVIETQNNQR